METAVVAYEWPETPALKDAKQAALDAARVRLRERCADDLYEMHDYYDWLPRYVGPPRGGLANQPPKVQRRNVYAHPLRASGGGNAP